MRTAAVRDVRALAARALGRGGDLKSPVRVEWDASGGCENPRTVEWWGRSEKGRPGPADDWQAFDMRYFGGRTDEGTMTLTVDVPCRRCRTCLRRRAAHWAARAHVELAAAPRTWFGTFTFSPDSRVKLQYRRDLRLLAVMPRSKALAAAADFREIASECSMELTKYLKRVRKETGVQLRYILVCEAHKDGFPHFHALIHEVSPLHPIRHAELSRQWKLGFSRFKLCPTDGKVAYYVCKYLSKSAETRVRASINYGRLCAPSG